MMRTPTTLLGALALIAMALPVTAYIIDDWWNDSDNIVMDDVLIPADTWSTPAQVQMTEWNQVDTTDNSHPFRIASNPQMSFGANDNDNTIGFLGSSGLSSEYGLSYANALAWTICWGSRIDECDVVLDPSLPWALGPDDDEWFQSTILHELGHVRGLDHYNNWLSMQNSGTNKKLRDEVLYMDDKEAVRQHAAHPNESDLVMYRKWHDGTPRWMTMSPTTLREGQTINLNNLSVENRGTTSYGSLRFGIYLSTNDLISTGDTLLNTGSFSSFGRFVKSTFNWSATIPSTFTDCTTRYIGGIIDDNGVYTERFEGNNDVPFSNGTYDPTPLNILLSEDWAEPNDSRAAAETIVLPFVSSSLSIDQDFENDYYRFTLSEVSNVNVDATFSHSSGNINMQLQNSFGSVLASATTTTSNESLALTGLAPGTYYVRLYGSGTGSCNQYTLSVNRTVLTAGEAPDLTVDRSGTNLRLTWDPSCSAGDGDFAVYEGPFGSFTTHIARTCSTSGSRTHTLAPASGNRYYLVVPTDSFIEGSYGRRSDGSERPPGIGPCAPQNSASECNICEHDKCQAGAALASDCEECVAAVCAADSFCCGTSWDSLCVGQVRTVCGNYTCEDSQGTCSHSLCETGDPLTASCDDPPIAPSCVDQVCAADSFCCDSSWDSLCVSQVTTVCGGSCD